MKLCAEYHMNGMQIIRISGHFFSEEIWNNSTDLKNIFKIRFFTDISIIYKVND